MESRPVPEDAERQHIAEQGAGPSRPHVDYDAASDLRIRLKLDRNMMPLFFILCEWHPLRPDTSEEERKADKSAR